MKAGIYHKLNTSKSKENLTSSECLKLLNNNELDGNLTTIFARLRNTIQYWLGPRSDIETMITWYGPVTFFLTLSPAEYNWERLDSYLRQVNNTTEVGKSLSALIAFDPVSTSRFIDKVQRYARFSHVQRWTIRCSDGSIKIEDYSIFILLFG